MLGLHGAVEEMIRHYDATHPECRFVFHSEGDFSGLGNELAISAYRIIQEALSNVLKHAGATHAQVSLMLAEDEDMLHIEIDDDGAGFSTGTASSGIGIIGMRERVYALGGRIDFSSEPDKGTVIAIALPIAMAE
jgi:two-component system sensor histidine kinase UhpB